MERGIDIGLDRVLLATGGALVREGRAGAEGPASVRLSGAVIDGRAAFAGALFFALEGERADGHAFVAQAIAAGAAAAVVGRGRAAELPSLGEAAVIEVDDPVAALGSLGRAHREALPALRVVAVTGSNGKTTTKEMLAAILAEAVGPEAVLKTEGNLNNHLGVPLTLLRLTAAHRYAVVELGMSALGEIAYLSGLAHPDVGVVLNVAGVHLETLGTVENVARAKAELWAGLGPEGVAIAPIDEALLAPHLERVPPERRRSFGPQGLAPSVGFDAVEAGPFGLRLRLHLDGPGRGEGELATIPLLGAHNAHNAAAAAAAARALGVGPDAILRGLARVRPAKHRAQLLAVGDRVVLDDCYNASPLSMHAALEALGSATPAGRRRIAVLGDMRELGAESAARHAELGARAASCVDALVAVGPEARHLYQAAAERLAPERVAHTDDPEEAAARAIGWSGPGDVILVKASRGMRLERVIDALVVRLGGGAS